MSTTFRFAGAFCLGGVFGAAVLYGLMFTSGAARKPLPGEPRNDQQAGESDDKESTTMVSPRPSAYGEQPRKLLVVTDVGKDIDDTVALATIAASDEFRLVGVVTTGGNTTNRARFARQLLRVLGVDDDQCDVIAGFDPAEPPNPKSRSYGHLPEIEGLPLAGVQDGDFIAGSHAPEHLLRLVNEHSGLAVVCLGPLTPLQKALEQDKSRILRANVGSLHFQGCEVDGRPDADSYNFREDLPAANAVFDHLRGRVPFCFVGKFAAYRVPLRTHHILEWDAARPQATSHSHPSWLEMAVDQMRAFRDSSTELYFDLYPVDVARAQQAGKSIEYVDRKGKPGVKQPQLMADDWYLYLKDDIMIKPYDPLVVISLIVPQLFTTVVENGDVFIGNAIDQPGIASEDSRVFEVLINERVKKASQNMKSAAAAN